jgi:sugar phosphate permease
LNRQTEAPSLGKPTIFTGWYIVFASWMMLFLLGSVSIGVFFKPILDEFGWSRATLSLLQTVSMLIGAAASPFLGRLLDKVGPRSMLFIVTATQAVSSAVTGLASGILPITIGRILAEIKPSSGAQVLVNRWFVKKRGQAQGFIATGRPIGTFALIPLSQYLILAWGWRATMLFWTAIGFAVMLVLTWFIRDNPEDRGMAADGEIPAAAFAPDGSEGNAAGVRVECGHTFPEAARTAAFWLLSAAQLICGIGCGFMMTHIVIFATDVGYSEMVGATFLSIHGIVNLAGVLLTGTLSDRIARSRVLSLTHFIRALSFAVIIVYLLPGGGSLWMLYVAMALFGFGWFTTAPLTAGLVADLFGYRRMGTIAGVMGTGHMLGTALGVYGGGLTFELTHSYYWFFVVQGGLELLAAVLAFSIRRRPLRHADTRSTTPEPTRVSTAA